MDATDQASIAGDHQLHEGLAEGTAVRRRLVVRPYCPRSDCLLVVAGNRPTGRQDLGCRRQLRICTICVGHGHMEGNAVARELWLVAIIGWIVGFNLAIFIVEIVFIALLSRR
jgi:hypothetical protein